MEREQFRDRIIAASGMPKDVVSGAPILTMTGRNELYIGNYRGITEYTDILIRIQTRIGQIRISGRRLKVDYYTNDEMKVTGTLDSVEFTDGRGDY